MHTTAEGYELRQGQRRALRRLTWSAVVSKQWRLAKVLEAHGDGVVGVEVSDAESKCTVTVVASPSPVSTRRSF